MKNYEALANLPFGIKKGDILTVDKKKVTNEKGDVIPIDPVKEISFFKEVKILKPSFVKDSLVIVKKPESFREYSVNGFGRNSFTIPAWTPVKVVGAIERNKSLYAIIDFNGKKYEIAEKLLIAYKPYYFINSSGVVHPTIVGRDIGADYFRMKSGNYFEAKEDATKELDKILAKPIKVVKSKTVKEVSA